MDAEYEDLFWLLCRHYEEHRCRGSGLLQHIYQLSQLPGPIAFVVVVGVVVAMVVGFGGVTSRIH